MNQKRNQKIVEWVWVVAVSVVAVAATMALLGPDALAMCGLPFNGKITNWK